jgi:hypothetical protein
MMSPARIKLKGQAILLQGGLCALCGARLPLDLHEVLLERDEAGRPGSELQRLALESWQNVMGLCNGCNIGPAKERANRDKLIGKQISRAGKEWLALHPTTLEGRPRDLLGIIQGANQLEGWLCSLPLKDVKPYTRRLNYVANGLMRKLGESENG